MKKKLKCMIGKHNDKEGLPQDRIGNFKYRCRDCGREEIRQLPFPIFKEREEDINKQIDFYRGLSVLDDKVL